MRENSSDKKRLYGNPEVDRVLKLKPEKRVRSSGNLLNDKIDGILIGFETVLDARNGHVDLITVKYAEAEIMALLEEFKAK